MRFPYLTDFPIRHAAIPNIQHKIRDTARYFTKPPHFKENLELSPRRELPFPGDTLCLIGKKVTKGTTFQPASESQRRLLTTYTTVVNLRETTRECWSEVKGGGDSAARRRTRREWKWEWMHTCAWKHNKWAPGGTVYLYGCTALWTTFYRTLPDF